MIVNTKYLTTVKAITNKHGEKIDLKENSTVQELLGKLIAIYGPKLREVIFPGVNKAGLHIAIMANNEQAFIFLDRLDTNLKDGDTVLIGTPLMGG